MRIAAVTENRSPQIPATNSEAYAVHCQFSHPFSSQTSCALMMLFLGTRGRLFSLISRSFLLFSGWNRNSVGYVVSVLAASQSVLFQCSGSRVSCRPWHWSSVSLEPSFWQFHWDKSSAVIKALNKKFT